MLSAAAALAAVRLRRPRSAAAASPAKAAATVGAHRPGSSIGMNPTNRHDVYLTTASPTVTITSVATLSTTRVSAARRRTRPGGEEAGIQGSAGVHGSMV
ncbi:hypothetical protein [Dactylosporangium cerinum]